MTSKGSIHHSVYYYLFILFSFLLPLYERAVPLVIILIVINWMAEGQFRQKIYQCLRDPKSQFILSFALLYLVNLVSLSYSHNLRQGIFNLQVGLSLLVFPVIFATIYRPNFSQEKTQHIFFAYAIGCFLSSILLLFMASARFANSPNPDEFLYINLAAGRHPAYFSMYLSLAEGIIIKYLSDNWAIISGKLKASLVLLLVFFSFMVLLLCSKAGIIVLIMVFMAFIIYSFRRKESRWLQTILSLLAVSFFITAFYLFPPSTGRFGKAFGTLDNYENIKSSDKESTATRILIWKSALKACIEKPLTGYGTGAVSEALCNIYKKYQVQHAVKNNLNAHNQYLQTALATGLPGLLILLAALGLPLILSFRQGSVLTIVFLLIIGINFLSESMLCRQAGVMFYAFFNGFILFRFDSESSDI
jgi:O-antigen ligase